MRILLDECVDQRLRLSFAGHDCQTAGYARLSGLKNGLLLTAAESAGFEVLITADQEIPYQQNLSMSRISIVILCAPTNRLADLQRLAPAVLRALDSIAPGQIVRIDDGTSRSIDFELAMSRWGDCRCFVSCSVAAQFSGPRCHRFGRTAVLLDPVPPEGHELDAASGTATQRIVRTPLIPSDQVTAANAYRYITATSGSLARIQGFGLSTESIVAKTHLCRGN